MGPAAVKAYLAERGRAPMSDLVHRFDSDPRALLGVLEFWMRRGKVRRLAGDACSGGVVEVAGLPVSRN
ncbi:hypothetical protein BI364_03345 [Acidihalobacter yilgarnensis]|uniref:Transcriptional regulator HTH-type FeoC domain-containing protein n=1 Tax=Acidihalobacter yilgarnensis TaxID=2819280 RepID=A0A1D8IL57_9GAMM|nr:hypothetical protein BI364_03345 [Acidihalobacter yilgarnensis]